MRRRILRTLLTAFHGALTRDWCHASRIRIWNSRERNREMSQRHMPYLFAAAALAAGAGVGAGSYAAFGSNSGNTTTIVQPASASGSPTAATKTLSVNGVYSAARDGVVEITTTGNSASSDNSPFPFGDGSKYSAKVVGADPSTDIAVLKVDAPSSKLHPLTLGDSSKVQVGDGVVAIGAPFGLDETVTSGIVSALNRDISSTNNYTIPNVIQTDAAINHGNSGGPLLDMSGQVIGITSQIESDSGGNDGVGFAVPSNTISSVVSKLIKGEKVAHPYLGISVQTPANRAGAQIASVKSGSPAAKAGLKAGDVVTAFAGETITSPDDLTAAVGANKPGDKVSVSYIRNGSTKTTEVTIGTRPS